MNSMYYILFITILSLLIQLVSAQGPMSGGVVLLLGAIGACFVISIVSACLKSSK